MSIEFNDELKKIINGALSDRAPMIVASVDPDGKPRMTFRGSVSTFSDDQLGFWARNPEGSTMDNIVGNPNVSLLLRNPDTRVMLQISGRARVAAVGPERDKVYDSAPEFEQRADADKKGAGVVVDVDKVEGFLGLDPDGKRRMLRMVRD